MRALHLDYQRTYRAMPWLGLAILLLALCAWAAVGWRYGEKSREARSWEQQADVLSALLARRSPAARPQSPQAAGALLLEVKQANQVVRALAVPWTPLFDAVDSAGAPGIALLALEPDARKGTVRIIGEARDLEVLLAYVDQLAQREVFASVLLERHQVQRDVAEKPLRFSLVARWKGVSS